MTDDIGHEVAMALARQNRLELERDLMRDRERWGNVNEDVYNSNARYFQGDLRIRAPLITWHILQTTDYPPGRALLETAYLSRYEIRASLRLEDGTELITKCFIDERLLDEAEAALGSLVQSTGRALGELLVNVKRVKHE